MAVMLEMNELPDGHNGWERYVEQDVAKMVMD